MGLKMLAGAVALLALFALACSGGDATVAPTNTPVLTATLLPTATTVPTPTDTPSPTATPSPPTPAEIFQRVSPSVAFVETPIGTGSGVLIAGNYVVTNAHVVWPFQKVRLVFPDGSEHIDAPVFSSDLMGDLAVIGPINTDVEPIVLEDGEDLVIGSELLLIGYPAETEKFPQPTITRGVLSRFRQWDAIEMTYFQTDATIAGGQSGGMLVSSSGEVIGISGFALSEAGFGLVASAADVMPRITGLIEGEDVAGLGDRSVPLEGGLLEYNFSLGDQKTLRTYVVNEPSGTTIDIEVSGENDVAFFLTDPYGFVLISADEGYTGIEYGSAITDLGSPYFLDIAQLSDTPGSFRLTSNSPLAPLFDADDGTSVYLATPVAANIDYPGDFDYFEIDLDEGETVAIAVDSMNIDPFLGVDFFGASDAQVAFDDDSGGGIFGLNSRLVYQAPHAGKFVISVLDASGIDTGGYFLSVEEAEPGETPVHIPPAPETVDSPFGKMSIHESQRHGFSIQYPAGWSEQPQEAPSETVYKYGEQRFFAVVEEEVVLLGLGELTLEEYVDVLVSDIFEPSGAEVISRTPVTSAQGLAAEILELELLGGQGRVKRFVMMTNDHVAFSASFVTLGLVYYELEPMIDYSFSTFRLEEAGYSP